MAGGARTSPSCCRWPLCWKEGYALPIKVREKMERLWHKNAHTGRRQSNVNVKRCLAFMRVDEWRGKDVQIIDEINLLGQLGRLVLANDEPDIWTGLVNQRPRRRRLGRLHAQLLRSSSQHGAFTALMRQTIAFVSLLVVLGTSCSLGRRRASLPLTVFNILACMLPGAWPGKKLEVNGGHEQSR